MRRMDIGMISVTIRVTNKYTAEIKSAASKMTKRMHRNKKEKLMTPPTTTTNLFIVRLCLEGFTNKIVKKMKRPTRIAVMPMSVD